MTLKKKLLIAALAVIVTGTGAWWYKRPKAVEKVTRTVTVTKGDITRVVEETGIIKPQVGAQVKVGTRATGELLKLRFQVGDRVRKGDLIALIDDRQDTADLDNAKANLAYQQESLRQVEATYPSRIAEQEAAVRSAESQAAYAESSFKRQHDLLRRGFSTQDEFDQSRKALDTAKAALDQQKATLKRVKDEFTSQASLSRSNIDQQRARIRNIEVNRGYSKIYAPLTGIVSQVATQEGETVVSGLSATSLITILDPTRLEVWIYVDETDIGKVREGMTVEYTVDAHRGRKFAGTVATINPQPEVKENIVYYLAKVYVDKDDAPLLKPEMTAHVRIMSERKKGVLLVPNAAVRFEGGKNVVMRPGSDPKKPLSVEVKTGIRDDRNTEITSGLNENDTVLVEGAEEPAAPAGGARKKADGQQAAPQMPPPPPR